MTLTVILKYHGIRCPHPGHVSDSLALSVEGPQDYCFSGAPHLHSWDEATQAPGTRQAGHEVSRSTPSTTTNINKTIYIYICVCFSHSKLSSSDHKGFQQTCRLNFSFEFQFKLAKIYDTKNFIICIS